MATVLGGTGMNFVRWWDTHAGFSAFVAGLIAALVTAAYVLLTRSLVREGRDSIKASQEANELTRRALEQERTIASRQREHDERLYVEAVRNRLDTHTPLCTVHVDDWRVETDTGGGVGTMSRDAFFQAFVRWLILIEVVNHGPGPAMLHLVEPEVGRLFEPGTNLQTLASTGVLISAGQTEQLTWAFQGRGMQLLQHCDGQVRVLDLRTHTPLTGVWDQHQLQFTLHVPQGDPLVGSNITMDHDLVGVLHRQYPGEPGGQH